MNSGWEVKLSCCALGLRCRHCCYCRWALLSWQAHGNALPFIPRGSHA